MKLSWKLLPVATLFALGVMFISFAGGKSAYAIDTVTTPGTAAIGTPVIISASITPTTTGVITLSAFSSTPNFGVFTSVPAAPTITTLEPITGSGGTTLQFTASTVGTRTLQAYFVCNSSVGNYIVSFTLAVAGIPTGQGSLSCGIGGVNPGTGQLTIYTTSTVLPIGGQGSFTATATTSTAPQYITISSTPLLINFQQANSNISQLGNTYDNITGQNTTTLFITATGPGPRTITGTFICNTTGTTTLTISLSQVPGVAVGGQTAYSQAVICGTGLVSPTVGPASAVTVAASPTSVGCSGTAFVTVTVRNALGGYVADGTSVTLASSVGSLSPTTATTLGGGVLAVFTAPSNQSGTANISASAAGTAQGTASITVTCNASTPTPAIPPTIYIPPVISNVITGGGSGGSSLGTGIISPPNTGDAGLATDNNDWQLFAGIALVVMSAAAGTAVVVRARA